MSDPKPTKGVIPPTIAGGEEVYNKIMGAIEPDLMTQNLPTLEVKYAGESKEQEKERLERYNAAFVKYKEEYETYRTAQKEDIRTFGRDILKFAEQEFKQDDDQKLIDLESAISDAAA